jgi:hypothetical protein
VEHYSIRRKSLNPVGLVRPKPEEVPLNLRTVSDAAFMGLCSAGLHRVEPVV